MDILNKAKSKLKPPPPSKPSHLSSTSKPSSQATSPSSATTRSKKRGLGWPWDQTAAHFPLYSSQSSSISWLFNWELWVPPGLPADGSIEWIPTVRTAGQVHDIDPFLSDITRANSAVPRITHFLGFNEPDIPDQANMSAIDAARLWKEHVLPAKQKFGFRLGSPGMSSDTGRSKPWLDEFFRQFDGGNRGVGVDFLVVHWYGTGFEAMASFLGEMYATYKLPLWLNEFACSNLGGRETSEVDVEHFMRQSVPFLEATDWIERYAYFGNGQGRDVGQWVGRQNNFTVGAENCTETDGRALSNIGRLYLQL